MLFDGAFVVRFYVSFYTSLFKHYRTPSTSFQLCHEPNASAQKSKSIKACTVKRCNVVNERVSIILPRLIFSVVNFLGNYRY